MPRKSPPVIASKNVQPQQSAKNSHKHPHKTEHTRAYKGEIGRVGRKFKVPAARIVQAQALLVQGKSQREIGRALNMSPMTVAKIIKTEDFQSYIKGMQERLFALAPVALASFQAQVKIDGHLAYTFMKDLGIIPSRETLATLITPAPTTTETGEERQAHLVACMLLEAKKGFGIDLPPEIDKALEEDHKNTEVEARKPGMPKNPQLR